MNTTSPHVTAVCGSLREGSYTRIALDHTLEAAAAVGATTDHIDLRTIDLPVYNADNNDAGEAVALRQRIRDADSVVLGSPMYHGSFATPLKNALDYCGFDEFEKTTVGLLAVSGGSFPITTLDHLRAVCRALDAWVLPHHAAIPSASSQFYDGGFANEDIAERVETLGHRLVQFASIEPDPDTFESAENVGADD